MVHSMYTLTEYAALLRNHGFRATDSRMGLLSYLARASKPLSIKQILAKWKSAPDQATLYRTLTDLSQAGIVRRIDLNTGTAHFEYAPDRPHHHHAVCTKCGDVEEIEACPMRAVESITGFASIYSHNLEFFGICKHCA